MIERVKNWLNNQLALGEASSRGQVVRRSVVMAVRIAALAYFLNVSAHLVMYVTGLLRYGLADAHVVATALTPLVSLPVAFAAYYVVGLAVYDLAVSKAEFERLSRTDSLSGLLNRRAFLEAIEAVVSPAALAIIDVDRFKSINDTYGHAAGDEVIVAVARRLSAMAGMTHVVSRIGGEEYAVLICGLSPGQVMDLVEGIRTDIENRPIVCDTGSISITVSVGVADCAVGLGFDDLFSHADKALYLAKVSGRNRVVHEREVAGLGSSARYCGEVPFAPTPTIVGIAS